MSTTTQAATTTPRKPSSTLWHAFLTSEITGTGQVLTAKSQRELKTQLNGLKDPFQVLSIVKGKSFVVQTKKSFEFVDEAATTEETLN